MLFIGVPAVQILAALVVFIERAQYAGAKLPVAPVIAEIDIGDVFAPSYHFSGKIAGGSLVNH